MRSTRLRACAGEALTPEWLHADHGTDHVAIDVDVAGMHARADGFHGLVDPRLDAVRQPVAGRVDGADERFELVLSEAHYVQNGPKDFARQLSDGIYFDQRRRKEGAAGARL